jgi:tetratricopeptide (TPR) repeat protein
MPQKGLKGVFSILLIWTCSVASLYGQGDPAQVIDSLEKKLTQTSVKREKYKIITNLIYHNITYKPEQAIMYGKKLERLLPKDSVLYKARVQHLIATAYYFSDSLELAIDYYQRALTTNRERQNWEKVIDNTTNLSSCYTRLGDWEGALKALYEAKRACDRIGDQTRVAKVYMGLSAIYLETHKEKQAIHLLRTSIPIFEELKDTFSLGGVYYDLGFVYESINQLDSARYFTLRAIENSRQIYDYDNLILALGELGYIALKAGEPQKATEYLLEALTLEDKLKLEVPERKIFTSQHLADAYFELEEYDKSIEISKANIDASHHVAYIEGEISAYESLVNNYKALEQEQEARKALEQLLVLKDSLHQINIEQEAANAESRNRIAYQVEKQIQANELLKVQNKQRTQVIVGVVIASLLILLIFYLLWQRQKARLNYQNANLSNKLLRNQMNPHFVFNSLFAIQSFVYQNKSKEAGKYLSSFAKLTRAVLENSRHELIPLAKEMEWLENYIHLQALRFQDQFDFKMEVGENIDPESVFIPPMLTQPFIENALEHGIQTVDYKGQIWVRFYFEDSYLKVVVEDNGIGIQDKDSSQNSSHKSLALEITKERLQLMNSKRNQKKVHFYIEPREPKGTIVSFKIPITK